MTEKILLHFLQIIPDWLMNGRGSMIRTEWPVHRKQDQVWLTEQELGLFIRQPCLIVGKEKWQEEDISKKEIKFRSFWYML